MAKANPEKSAAIKKRWYTSNPGYCQMNRISKQERALGRKKPPKCDTCGASANDIRLCLDHCHKTGKARGWLCIKCNSALGLANDSPRLLRKLADYLDSHKKKAPKSKK
jgi:hypothetical protein